MFLITILLISLALSLNPSSSFGDDTPLTLVYSSNTLGEVEPCGTCLETGNNGGLARRAHYIKKVREEVKNLLLLDGGDALVMSYFDRPSEREKARKRAEFVLKVYERMGYEAVCIGDTDLALGVEYLRSLEKKSKIPFISANLKDKKTGEPIFNPYLVKEIGGLKVGIIGLLTPNIHPNIQKEIKGYFIENPIEVASEAIKGLKVGMFELRFGMDPIKVACETIKGPLSHCDHIFALAHLNPPEIESLAKEVPRVSIITGGNDRSFIFPQRIHQSIYVQTDAFGAHIGRLNLKLAKGSSGFVDITQRNLIQKNMDEIQKKIEDPQYAREIGKLKEIQKQFNEQLNKMPSVEGKNTFENHLSLMHPGMESDKEIEKLIDSSRDQLKRPLP
jgi:2',3'-cyclic-nucleotide 2'-phosphodiesterase (5'-nucleotidase family)